MKQKTAFTLFSAGLVLSAIIGITTITTATKAQSFSCANAKVPSELAICNNENLLVKDELLASLFADALVEASQKNKMTTVSAEHSLWLKKRNACKTDFACLEKLYDERIVNLNQSL